MRMNKRFYFILFFPKEKRHTRNEYVKRQRRRRQTIRKSFARIFVQQICRHESCPRVRDLGDSWIYEYQTGHKWYFKTSGTADIYRIQLAGLFQWVYAILFHFFRKDSIPLPKIRAFSRKTIIGNNVLELRENTVRVFHNVCVFSNLRLKQIC